jgi:hypothetical protein
MITFLLSFVTPVIKQLPIMENIILTFYDFFLFLISYPISYWKCPDTIIPLWLNLSLRDYPPNQNSNCPLPPVSRDLQGHCSVKPSHDSPNPSSRLLSSFFLNILPFLDLFYSSALIPKLLGNFIWEQDVISYSGCMTQLFLFCTFAECYMLAAMAKDRQGAICNPLLYNVTMSPKV